MLAAARFPRYLPLFWFPDNVNEWTTRVRSLQVVIICILSIIFRERTGTRYMLMGLVFDYTCAIIGGARMSILGTIAELVSMWLPRILVPGPPKQFAAFCGLMMTSIGGGLFFGQARGFYIAGSVVLAILAALASLEGILNFCMGCWMFGMAARFRILVSDDSLEPAMDRLDEQSRFLKDEEDCVKLPAIKRYQLQRKSVSVPASERSDDQLRGDFHPIRHLYIEYFAAPLGMTGLAVLWKVLDKQSQFSVARAIWVTLTIFSGVWFGAFLVLYFLKMVMFFRKVQKEWAHPIAFNAFAMPLMNIVLYSGLTVGETKRAAAYVLFWAGGPLLLFITAVSISRLVRTRRDPYYIQPAMMMSVLGSLVAAYVMPQISSSYTEPAYLWFAISAFMWIVLEAAILYRAATKDPIEDSSRPYVWVLAAAPALLCSVYLVLNPSNPFFPTGWDFGARFFFYVMAMHVLAFVWLFICSYFGRNRWDMNYWAYSFCFDVIAVAVVQYDNFIQNTFTHILVYATVFFATWTTAAQFFHTMVALLRRRRIFVARDKWGPQAFMKAMHMSFRFALGKLKNESKLLAEQGGGLSEADLKERVKAVQTLFTRIDEMIEDHAAQEDQVLFPVLREWYPRACEEAIDEHRAHAKAVEAIKASFNSLNGGTAPALPIEESGKKEKKSKKQKEATEDKGLEGGAKGNVKDCLAQLNGQLVKYADDLCTHMDTEELRVAPATRKILTLRVQRDLVRRMWELIPHSRWQEAAHFVMEFAPQAGHRLRYIKGFVWAMPDQAQLLGYWVHESVPDPLWYRITEDVPEIIPRGLPGHEQTY